MRPRDPVELLVERTWAAVLRRPWLDVRRPFGGVGGDARAQREMLARLARESGVAPLPDAVVRAETIEAQAAALKRASGTLREAARAFWARNVALPPGEGRPSLFFFHGLRGGGLQWLEPMDRLGADQPVYGIAPHVTSGGAVPETVEAIARDHLRLVRAIQPDDPYLLGGFCNGAVTAFEAAAQLLREGARVTGLVLVAPMLPATYRRGAAALVIRLTITPIDRLLAEIHSLGLRHRLWRAVNAPFRTWRRPLGAGDGAAVGSPDELHFERYSSILQAYAPTPLALPATIIWPRREPRRYRIPSAWAWRRLLPGASVVRIPGTHGGWATGGAAIAVARELRRAIDAVGDREGSITAPTVVYS